MARSQSVLKDRIRNGILWRFIPWKPGDARVDRFVFSDSCTTVEVAPSHADIGWLVVVDGVEVLELYGPRAQQMAFAAADAFALQSDSLITKLRDQGFTKTRNRTKRRRR